MTVPSNGILSLGRIRNEISNNNYNSVFSSSSTGLKDAALGNIRSTNLANLNANKPDNSSPHAMSEFYKYDKDGSPSTSPGSFSQFSTSGATNQNIQVEHAAHSTWYVSSKPSWITITNSTFGSSNTQTGGGNVTFSVNGNLGSARSGTIVVRLNVGTSNGAHPSGTDSFTTRTTSVSQAGSGGDGPGGEQGRGEP
tara:strand:+ start:355 stop:942 length:588 start_codon:yes stop_codon:yes gene_type:complete